MTVPRPYAEAVRTCFRAILTRDAALLATVSLPHAELATLTTRGGGPHTAQLLDELSALQMHGEQLPGDRYLVKAFLGGIVQLLVLEGNKASARIDQRYWIAAEKPADDKQQVARAFYAAMLLGDLDTLQQLSFDARGVELLAENPPPAGEAAQLEHVASAMAIIELQPGDVFAVPGGKEFVGPRHAELGIVVQSGLTPNGEVPFLLRQREGQWKVIPFHFIHAAVLARGGSMQQG